MFLREGQVNQWEKPEEARERTRELIAAGADFIKVYTGSRPRS